MTPERMARRQIGMIEIFRRIASHSEFFHNAPRSEILRYGEADKRLDIERFERVANDLSRALSRQSLPPILR